MSCHVPSLCRLPCKLPRPLNPAKIRRPFHALLFPVPFQPFVKLPLLVGDNPVDSRFLKRRQKILVIFIQIDTAALKNRDVRGNHLRTSSISPLTAAVS